jgi:geranylgeranyl pyrophosphate synthase
MRNKYYSNEVCRKILEDNGGLIADKARRILLEDRSLKDLRQPLEFISKSWRDLTPALMRLSCQAVGGQPEETNDAAIAMCLMHLSFSIWDDIIDKVRFKSFKPTLPTKFGESTSIIVAGLAAAKAFSIINEANLKKEKRQLINEWVWQLCSKMARTETLASRMRTQGILSSNKKLWKIKSEASDLATCLKIGAVIGNGSENDINHLGNYGMYLGIIFSLRQDFQTSINLTLELADKIKNNSLPYSILWATEHSEKINDELSLAQKNAIDGAYVKEFVKEVLNSRVFDHVARKITAYSEKAKEELIYIKTSSANQTLRSFVDIQSRLFVESFSI